MLTLYMGFAVLAPPMSCTLHISLITRPDLARFLLPGVIDMMELWVWIGERGCATHLSLAWADSLLVQIKQAACYSMRNAGRRAYWSHIVLSIQWTNGFLWIELLSSYQQDILKISLIFRLESWFEIIGPVGEKVELFLGIGHGQIKA